MHGMEWTETFPAPIEETWSIPGLIPGFRVHPRWICRADHLLLVEAWSASRGTPGHLPFSGGLLDQPAVIYDAFQVIGQVDAALRKAAALEEKAPRR